MNVRTMPPARVPAELATETCRDCNLASLGIYRVIHSLNGNGRLPCQAKTADRTGMKPSTVNRHCTYLFRAGLLERVEGVKLTERQL